MQGERGGKARRFPAGLEIQRLRGQKKMLPSQGFGTRAKIASWCHPNSGPEPVRKSITALQCLSRRGIPFGLLLRGGCRGRFRPRSATVLPPVRTARFQQCAPLCGSAARVLLWHLCGLLCGIVCVFEEKVKQSDDWSGDTYCASPDRPAPDRGSAFRRCRCCWQRGCCSGRRDGRYRRSHRPYARCWGR